MATIISLYFKHDGGAAIYDTDTKQFHILPFDRLTGLKHFFTESPKHHERALKALRAYIDEHLPYTEFDVCIYQSLRATDKKQTLQHIPAKHYEKIKTKHHDAHIKCASAQSPFSQSHFISYDGIGDMESFVYGQVDHNTIVERDTKPWKVGHSFNDLAKMMPELDPGPHGKRINQLDYAGKIMGLAAYGTPSYSLMTEIDLKFYTEGMLGYGITSDITGPDVAATTQQLVEDNIIDFIEEWGISGNLIMTGGCALNVLVNEKIRTHFGDSINLYVPPNPDDSGLAFGYLIAYLEDNQFDVPEQVDLSIAGMELLDNVEDYKTTPTTVKEVTNDLVSGKVIGWIEGPGEIGPRALGRRSLLCDPSDQQMKDRMNEVKRRERFRPFAPICRPDTFDQYFDTPSRENHESMSYAVKVKPHAINELAAITHADNTARVQILPDGFVLSEVLDRYGTPLLNTSFNIQGKPILNSIADAKWMKDNCRIDGVVIVRSDGTLVKLA